MRVKFGCSQTVVSKKGADTQRETAALYSRQHVETPPFSTGSGM